MSRTDSVISTGPVGAPSTPEGKLQEFREHRSRAVIAEQGTLALVNTQWITGDPSVGQPVWGVPGLWFPLPGGVSGLRLTAVAADNIRVDGDLVDGTVIVAGKDSLAPSEIRFSTTLTGYVIANEDGDYALRVWDAASQAIASFGSISAFPYNPDWVIEARFERIEGGGHVGIAHLKDEGKTRQKFLPGVITFSRDGVDYTLAAFEDNASLLLVFADSTNGDTTYSVGRFLRVTPSETDTVVLDFNRAYLPPCAFSYNFNCPIPPEQNRFPVPIEAGEQMVLDTGGDPLH